MESGIFAFLLLVVMASAVAELYGKDAANRLVRFGFVPLIASMLLLTFVIHMVPVLVWSGISTGSAAGVAGLIGLASVFGKLVAGWLADRTSGGLLPFAAFAGPSVAYFLIWQGHGSLPMITAAMLISGFCNGALSQLAAYLLSRYAGLAQYGTIFGLIASMMAVGSGIGPYLAGFAFDRTQSYELLLLVGMPLALVAGLAVAFLGPYPHFARQPVAPDAPQESA